MKPLLRAVLVIDALLLLAFGLLFLLTPWTSLYNALQLTQVQPALVGQGFGFALLVVSRRFGVGIHPPFVFVF